MDLRDQIDAHKELITDRLDPDFGLLDELLASRSLTRSEVADVKAVSHSYGRSGKLLEYVCDRGIYEKFLDALRDTQQTHLVNFIRSNGGRRREFGDDWPLTKRELSILDTNQRSLVDLLETCELLRDLYSHKVVNNRQRDFVSSKTASHEKNDALLEILRRTSLQNYKKTIHCLHSSKQSHIADVLKEGGGVVRVRSELQTESDVNEVEDELIMKITEMLGDRSFGESTRILECTQLRLIAVKKGNSIILYFFRKTLAELIHIQEMQTSGKLANVIREMFNEMLSRRQVINLRTTLYDGNWVFVGRVKKNTCKYIEGKTPYSDCPGEKPRLGLEILLDSSFFQTILNFFKKRFKKQYPLTKGKLDEFEEAKYQHDAFMESREKMVFGRKGVITEIIDYIENQPTTLPNLILGEAGQGKSSIVLRAASQFKERKKGDARWIIFYHFVGAVPNSASLLLMLRRLLHEIGFVGTVPTTLDRALTDVYGELSRNHDDQRFAIFIDALNQLDLDLQMDAMVGWLPETLGRNVRCVLSMITKSDAHKSLIRRTNPPIQNFVPQLKEKTRKKIVDRYLGQFKKKLDDKQMDTLMAKKASENCLWLKVACEEMRVFGEFKAVTKLIEQLPDRLPQ